MALGLRVASDAQAQIRTALEWWAEHRRAAPSLLEDELEQVFGLITTFPNVGLPSLDPANAGTRRVVLRRSRYQLYYVVRDEVVEVLALWHSSRGSGPPLSAPV